MNKDKEKEFYPQFLEEEIERLIRETRKEPGLSLTKLARAIVIGLGDDLPALMIEIRKHQAWEE